MQIPLYRLLLFIQPPANRITDPILGPHYLKSLQKQWVYVTVGQSNFAFFIFLQETRLYKKSTVLLIGFILFAVFIHLMMRGGVFSDQLTPVIQARIQGLTRSPVTIQRTTLSLVPMALILEDVVLPYSDPARPPITIEQVRVTVSPWSLLTRVLFIKNVRLENPRIELRIGEAPLLPIRTGPDEIPPENRGDQSQRMDFVIREIDIRNGYLEIQQPSKERSVLITGLSGNIRPDLLMKNYDSALRAKSVTVDGKGYHKKLDSMTADISLRPQLLEIRELELTDSASRFTVRGAVRNPTQPELALTVDASFPLADLKSLLKTGETKYAFSGEMHFAGEVIGRWPDPTFRGNMDVKDIEVFDRAVGDFKTAFLYHGRSLSLSDISASIFGGTASGSLDLSMPDPSAPGISIPYRVSLSLKDLEPSGWLPLLGIEGYTAQQRLEAQLDLEGFIDDMTVRLANLSGKGWLHLVKADRGRSVEKPLAESGPSGPNGLIAILSRLEELSMEFRLDQGKLIIQEAAARSPQTELAAQGSIQPDGSISLDVSLVNRDLTELDDFIRPGVLGGYMELSGRLTGTIKHPVFKGKGRADDLKVRGRSFETAESDLLIRDAKLRFKRAVFQEKNARYEVRGVVSWNPQDYEGSGPYFDLHAKIDEGSPHEVVAIFTRELPIFFPATGRLVAKGTPKDFRLMTTLEARHGSIYGQTIDGGTTRIVITPKLIRFEKITATRGETTAAGKGTIRFKRDFEFSVSTTQGRLEDLDPVNRHIPNLKGLFSGRLSGQGSFKDPHLETQIDLLGLLFQGQSLGPGTLTANVKNRLLTADLRLSSGATALGELEWRDPFPFRAQISLRKVDVKSWLGRAVAELKEINGITTTGTVKARGQIRPAEGGLEHIQASIHLTALEMEFPNYVITNEGDIHLGLRDGNVNIQSMRLKGPGTALNLSGSLELLTRYNLFVSGEADLDLFRIFTDEIGYGKGLAYLAVQITDEWENPEIRGGLTVHDGTLRSESLGQAIQITFVGLAFNKRQIFLESLDAEFGGGKVQAIGRINLVRFVPAKFAVNLEISGAEINPVEGLKGLIDASLVFQGDPENQYLNGEILIRRASYERRLDWQTWVLTFLQEEERESRPSDLLRNISFNIHVEGKDNLWINNNLAKISLEVDLLLKGTPVRPILLGRLHTKGGTFSFRRNDFKVTSGTVDFINPDRIRPILDVQAVTRVRNYTIDMNLIGPVDKFDLILSSNPSLRDENDILCLLTFRKPCRDVAETSKEIGAAEASALLSAGIQNIITDKVEQATGIDRIQVDPYYSSSGSGSSPMVTVSKRLLEDKLYVTYATTFNPSEEQLIQMEYVLSKNISLIGNRDEVGRLGGDLKFHFEFR